MLEETIRTAIQANNNDAVQILIDYGVKVDSQVADTTPLFLATEAGHYEVVQTLLNNSACLDISKRDGTTPFDVAVEKQDKTLIDIFLHHLYPTQDVVAGEAFLLENAMKGCDYTKAATLLETGARFLSRATRTSD